MIHSATPIAWAPTLKTKRAIQQSQQPTPANGVTMTRASEPDAPIRLICFPYAGGGLPVFRDWPDSMPDLVEVRVLQLPGRGARLREASFTQLTQLVKILAEELRPLFDVPCAFFGHSVGALICFELARALRQQNIEPFHMFVSGNSAPQLPNPNPEIHHFSDEQFLAEIKALNGMPQLVLDTPELLKLLLPAVRADFTLTETNEYQPQPPLECPITVFGGERDPRTNRTGLEEWGSQTTAAFELHTLPGDHFFIDQSGVQLRQLVVEALNNSQPMQTAKQARKGTAS